MFSEGYLDDGWIDVLPFTSVKFQANSSALPSRMVPAINSLDSESAIVPENRQRFSRSREPSVRKLAFQFLSKLRRYSVATQASDRI
jgi:hypothetical protein